jgi:hypothetical protein
VAETQRRANCRWTEVGILSGGDFRRNEQAAKAAFNFSPDLDCEYKPSVNRHNPFSILRCIDLATELQTCA